MRGLLLIFGALALGVACGGPHLQPHHDKGSPSAPGASGAPGTSGTSGASTSASATSVRDPDETQHAFRWLNAAFGCFSGGAWMEAIGSLGEERTLATLGRCRTLVAEALGRKLDDDAALTAVREMRPEPVNAIIAAIEKAAPPKRKDEIVAVIRAYTDAAREALNARHAADAARKGKPLDEAAVTASGALAKLHGLTSSRAKVSALVLAADHLESARGLDSRGKALTASPCFDVVFGVARQDAWAPYALAAAKAAGHPVTKEDDALAAVAEAFADRFEALAAAMQGSEPKEAAVGYAKRLRQELAEKKKP